MENNKKAALALLKIGAVFLRPEQPFTWTSGIKSPIYCDNRLILTSPEYRNEIEKLIAETAKAYYPDHDVLVGTSTAGIAHAAIAAHILGVPMGYVRSGSKDHGRQKKIEGKIEAGAKAVVIEDLISTGGSVIDVVETLREVNVEVLGIVSIFSYNMQKGIDNLNSSGVKNISLTNLDILLEVAAEHGYLKHEDVERCRRFRDNPSDESWMI